jgi:hypothetical protein
MDRKGFMKKLLALWWLWFFLAGVAAMIVFPHRQPAETSAQRTFR